ncbi:hypothetical protein EMIHUDRAFT_470729, partial [Emiliania huxleyi CCMP1516]|uniref:Uncharacterized protein n=2 Tax=Emiliania huxleyi TaxID=2903 RepID=A0A0D3IQ26_EMIH1
AARSVARLSGAPPLAEATGDARGGGRAARARPCDGAPRQRQGRQEAQLVPAAQVAPLRPQPHAAQLPAAARANRPCADRLVRGPHRDGDHLGQADSGGRGGAGEDCVSGGGGDGDVGRLWPGGGRLHRGHRLQGRVSGGACRVLPVVLPLATSSGHLPATSAGAVPSAFGAGARDDHPVVYFVYTTLT